MVRRRPVQRRQDTRRDIVGADRLDARLAGEAGEWIRVKFAPFTALFDVTGQPAISIPVGFGEDGLPTAV
ncbi:MAG TPA: hypothetical protein VK631_08770, partial [Solirubrobacteraceae bacterium]|nr:hypothetical protein [Solirubrobacteraceae bacterium]